MNIFGISGLLVFISAFLIGVIAFSKSKRTNVILVFSSYAFSVAIWGLGAYKISTIKNPEDAFWWWRLVYIIVILIPVVHYHFIYAFLKLQNKVHKYLLRLSYITGIIFIAINLCSRPLFLGGVRYVFNSFYYVDWFISKSWIYLAFYIGFYWILLGYVFWLVLRSYWHSTGVFKNQLKYIIIASIISWPGAEGVFLPIFRLDIFSFSNLLLVLYPLIIVYVIIKYRLMDIRVAITRVGVFIFVYTFVLGLPFVVATTYKTHLIEILGPEWWLMPLGLMAVLATVGPFIYIYVQRKAEETLLREQRQYQQTLKHASVGMTRIRSLKRLLDLIVHIITKTVKISYAGIYLYDSQNNEFILHVARNKGTEHLRAVSYDNPLVAWVMVKREPLVYEEIKRYMEDTHDQTYKHLEENMRVLQAIVVVPIFLENRFMGFVVLGEKNSGQIYTIEDLNVFQILASQAALAIENAQFYEDAKEMQAQIAQAEKMATIGTMADGLSHQINNRFYALSLIAGDTIDTIKTTDTANCSSDIKEMIKNISYALERIQNNVMQGGEVVKGILKYSRRGDENFGALALDDILDGTIDMVQFKIKLKEIDIVRDYPKDIPKIYGNLVQLQEVFFNFIDNAYDAIVERRTTLNEKDYRGKIVITAIPREKTIEIIVEDNGMGIKDNNNAKIFTPFFTTKISARKGTGLGLYVIRKIITEAHNGRIMFHSVHAQGTRFTLILPIIS
ncbi:MAG: ATP-binding protein [Candidatus Omnitrophica bacterium]|jgi:two-component system NtrC family sensor kinase|nr:ATP-binding protein [Candidatus Omnitrophota bacterium]